MNEFMECLNGKGILPPTNRLAKARMNSFLASRNEPDTRLGIAAAKGYIPWHNAAFTDLTLFLKNL